MQEKQILIYQGKYLTAEFYKDIKDKIPALDYYNTLTKKERAEFFALLRRLTDRPYGEFLPETKYRAEDKENSIYALKFSKNRYLNFTTTHKKIIITNGFRKKIQKLGKREKKSLEFAVNARLDYLKRVKEGRYYEKE